MEMSNVKEAFARVIALSAVFAAFSTRGGPVPVMFDVKGSKHHAAATKAIAGAEAPGVDFRVVRTRPGKADTAWRVRSKRMALPSGTVAVAFEFEICSDSDWRPVTWDSATWDTRIAWFDSDGNPVKGRPWWDALGAEREAEKLDLRFKPGSYSRFRVTRDVPVNATTNDVVARIKAGPAAPGKGFVMHEERNVKIDGGGFFEDAFGPFAVHIYRIPAAGKK